MDVRYLIQSNELISVFSLDFLSLGFFSLGVFSLNLQSFMLDVSNSGFTPSDIIGYMKSFLFTKNEQFFAYYYSPTLSHLDSTHLGSSKNLLLQDRRVEQVPFDGWDIYSHVREFERQGLYEKCAHNTLKWRVSTMNEHYQICDSYPCLLGVSAVMGVVGCSCGSFFLFLPPVCVHFLTQEPPHLLLLLHATFGPGVHRCPWACTTERN